MVFAITSRQFVVPNESTVPQLENFKGFCTGNMRLNLIINLYV